MVFSLFACGEEITTLTDSPATDAPTEEKTEEKTEAPTSEKTEAPTQEKTEAPTDEPTETEEPTEAPCAHEEVVLEGKAATCTEAGLTEGKKCSKCEEILVAQEDIPATGHTEETLAAVAPTCTATGLTEGKKCSVCEAVLTAQETVAALGHTEETLNAVAPTCQATGLTEGKKCSVCNEILVAQTEVAIDPNAHNMDNGTPAEAAKCGDKATVTYKCQNEGCTHTNVVEGEVLAHDMDEGTVTTAPTCTEKGVKTFKCKREGCTHTTTEAIDALGHKEETVAGKAATCTATGLTEGKKCSACGVTTVEQNEIPVVAHTEETVAGKDATCTATGLTEGKKCSVCGTVTKAQEEVAIDPNAHKWVDVPAKKPAPHEDGHEAYKDCEYCDKIANTEGAIIDSITTIPGLDCEIYMDAEDIYNKDVNVKASVTETLEGDGSYVRYLVNVDSIADGTFMIVEGNTKVTGQYIVFKYRTDHIASSHVWANTKENNPGGGAANGIVKYTADGNWHIAVIDLSALIPTFVKPDESGNYTIQWCRLDFLDNGKKDKYMDMAFIMLCDDLRDAAYALDQADKDACTHPYTWADEECRGWCSFCGKDLGVQHDVQETYKDEGNVRTYTKACVNCGGAQEYTYTVKFGDEKPLVFRTAADLYAKPGATGLSSYELSADGTYVTFFDKKDAGEGYIHPYTGTKVTGQYLLLKYRTTKAQFQFYLGANNGRTAAAGGEEFYFNPCADGQWQVVIIDMSKSAMFKPNDDGTYSASYIRWDLLDGKGTGDRSVDVGYVAISDDINELLAIDDLDYYTSYLSVEGKNGKAQPMSAHSDNPHFSADALANKSSQATLMFDEENGNMPFARYLTNKSGKEQRFTIWTSNAHGRSVANTGNYLMYMYRKDKSAAADWTDIFISSNLTGPIGSGDSLGQQHYTRDGEWHIVLINLAKVMNKEQVTAGTLKSYYAPEEGLTSLAIDWINADNSAEGVYVDVAFVGFFDTAEDAADYVKLYQDKYMAGNCNHDIMDTNSVLVDDGNPDTCYAIKSDKCSICGASMDAVAIKSAINVDSIVGSKTFRATGTYDAAANGVTAAENGTVKLGNGWAGTEFASKSTLAYRVLAADGTTLKDWTETGKAFYPSGEPDVVKAVQGAGLPGENARRISTDEIDLKEFFTENETVTVEIALIIEGAPEGSNDKYVSIVKLVNLGAYKAPAEEPTA